MDSGEGVPLGGSEAAARGGARAGGDEGGGGGGGGGSGGGGGGAGPARPMPCATVRGALEVLCADPRNTVVVMSRASCGELQAAFGAIPACSLCAENGQWLSWAGLHGRWAARQPC